MEKTLPLTLFASEMSLFPSSLRWIVQTKSGSAWKDADDDIFIW